MLGTRYWVLGTEILGSENGRADPPAVSRNPRLFSLLLVDCLLQFGSRGKLRDLAGSNLDSGSGLRIAPVAGFSLRYRESAETNQRYPIPFSQRRRNAAYSRINRSCSLRFADFASARDLINQIGLVHVFLLAGLFFA